MRKNSTRSEALLWHIAAVLGFGGLADTSASIAKLAFVVFIVLAIASFVFGRRAPA
jgi:uncharacterized membrane protein YtjA (UPF0391 family)